MYLALLEYATAMTSSNNWLRPVTFDARTCYQSAATKLINFLRSEMHVPLRQTYRTVQIPLLTFIQ